jgi:hypothetical protein
MGAISRNGTPNTSCNTNARRSAGVSASRTASSASPSESPRSASCSGSTPASGLTIGSGTCVSSGASRRVLRERSMFRHTRPTTVVSRPVYTLRSSKYAADPSGHWEAARPRKPGTRARAGPASGSSRGIPKLVTQYDGQYGRSPAADPTRGLPSQSDFNGHHLCGRMNESADAEALHPSHPDQTQGERDQGPHEERQADGPERAADRGSLSRVHGDNRHVVGDLRQRGCGDCP